MFNFLKQIGNYTKEAVQSARYIGPFTQEYELGVYDRHELNMDNVAMGRVPFTLDEDPMVVPLRELVYLPKGVLDPHGLPPGTRRAGKLPDELLEAWQEEKEPTKEPIKEPT